MTITNLICIRKPNTLKEKSITAQAQHCAGRILLIEAEALTRKQVVSWLGKWNYQVWVAESAATALSKAGAADWTPDIVLAGCQSGNKLSGILAIQGVQQQLGRDIAGILAAADITPSCVRAARKRDYLILSKPIQPARLRAAIRYCLLKRRSRR